MFCNALGGHTAGKCPLLSADRYGRSWRRIQPAYSTFRSSSSMLAQPLPERVEQGRPIRRGRRTKKTYPRHLSRLLRVGNERRRPERKQCKYRVTPVHPTPPGRCESVQAMGSVRAEPINPGWQLACIRIAAMGRKFTPHRLGAQRDVLKCARRSYRGQMSAIERRSLRPLMAELRRRHGPRADVLACVRFGAWHPAGVDPQ